MHTRSLRQDLTKLQELNTATDKLITTILTTARHTHPDDRHNAAVLLEAAQTVGRCEQARHGQLIQLLAQADRVRANRGGLAPWIATHLDVTPGRSRAIAQSARRIGHLPALAKPLSSGTIGADTARTLTRAARAIEHTTRDQSTTLTATLELTERDGLTAANRHIRELEESLDPGRAQETLAKQRKRSFTRITETTSGMYRIEALLDPVRASTVRTAIDQQSAAWIRARQFDHNNPLPPDVHNTEQIQAQALTRLAEVFLTTAPTARTAPFTPATIYHLPLNPAHGALAETAYGDLVPRSAAAPLADPAAHLIEHDNNEPVLLDGQPIDTNPTTRLATPAQRIALAYRDRHCTHPGCTRPATWSLHAHHQIPHSQGGPTTLNNLTLLCPQHHTHTHHPHQ